MNIFVNVVAFSALLFSTLLFRCEEQGLACKIAAVIFEGSCTVKLDIDY